MIDPDELEALGLYDPALHADERRALLALALEHGATIDEIRAAIDGSRLHALAVERLLLREGDLFGSVVNLAARLETLAQPGQALPDAATARHLGPDQTQPLGPRSVAGFDDPVEVYALTR